MSGAADLPRTAPPAASGTQIAAELERARRRTEALLAPLSREQLTAQISPLMSPLVWDLAHIANFEELWLLRELGGEPADGGIDDEVYDATAHARAERAGLELLSPERARAYAASVRARSLALLERLDLGRSDPLLEGGFVFGMVIQHELQHLETMAQALQLGGLPGPQPGGPASVAAEGFILVPAGRASLGASAGEPWAYDNERPEHERELEAFRIARGLVTCGEYARFVEEGGYRDRRLWSEEGFAWVESERIEAPLCWERSPTGFGRSRFGTIEPLAEGDPVEHVSWYEADAFARFVGARLPTEAEWEKAAREGEGLEQLQGAVWQWTASDFRPYPGFRAFPYREYSEVFFGSAYRVLRGSSWVTDPLLRRPSFRNWDLPVRRQIFSGIRLAADA